MRVLPLLVKTTHFETFGVFLRPFFLRHIVRTIDQTMINDPLHISEWHRTTNRDVCVELIPEKACCLRSTHHQRTQKHLLGALFTSLMAERHEIWYPGCKA